MCIDRLLSKDEILKKYGEKGYGWKVFAVYPGYEEFFFPFVIRGTKGLRKNKKYLDPSYLTESGYEKNFRVGFKMALGYYPGFHIYRDKRDAQDAINLDESTSYTDAPEYVVRKVRYWEVVAAGKQKGCQADVIVAKYIKILPHNA